MVLGFRVYPAKGVNTLVEVGEGAGHAVRGVDEVVLPVGALEARLRLAGPGALATLVVDVEAAV